MTPYSEYKESRVPWLGKIPSHWKLLPCRAIVDNQVEKNDSGKIEEYLSLMANIGVVRYEEKGDVGNKKPEDLTKCKLVKQGNLVINSMNYAIGSYGMSPFNGVCSPVYIVLEPKEQIVERRYALRLFENKPMQKHLAQLGNGILQHRAAIKWDDIKSQAVPVPPLEEQRAILYFLDREIQRIDSLIEEKQTFIKLLKEKRQALISHVVTKGLNPNVEMQDSGIEWIGQVPKHWVIRRLKHTSTLQSGIAKGKDNANKETLSVPMLRVANVQDGYVKLDDVHEINVLPHEVERYALKDGDVLMNEGGDNDKLGRGTVWKEQIKPCIHQNHVFVIRVTDIEPEWLGWLTQSAYAKFYFFRVSKQSTNLASISSTNVKEVHLLIPPADERKIIMEYLEKQTSKLKLLVQDVEQSITLLKEHRTSLISAAVTGKIDVRETV